MPKLEPMIVEPVVLAGRHVRLEPLSADHHTVLCEVAFDADLWRWTPATLMTPEAVRAYLDDALKAQAEGVALPFATYHLASGRVVGSTRFGNIDAANRRAEIGWTWVGKAWQRTAVNTEAKYLMLQHAFEVLGCIRIELKTDVLNQPSRAAILRLGAKEEGTFRNHLIMPDGRIRHSVYYSIIDAEWPEVKAGLQAKLTRAEAPA